MGIFPDNSHRLRKNIFHEISASFLSNSKKIRFLGKKIVLSSRECYLISTIAVPQSSTWPYPHVSNKNVTVSNMQEEVHRLSTNWRTLLDAMPEMVFLLRETGEVEYMNRSAKGCFGFPCGGRATTCLREVSQQCGTILNDADDCDATEQGRVTETLIDTTPVEYSSVPFVGYTGEKLIMLVMRDITQRKNFERELLQFNTSIETILQQKISELQASEETRIRSPVRSTASRPNWAFTTRQTRWSVAAAKCANCGK